MTKTRRRPITQPVEFSIIQLTAQGKKPGEISKIVKEKHGVSHKAKVIREVIGRNKEAIETVKDAISLTEGASAVDLLLRFHRMIAMRLRVDEVALIQLEILSQKLRDGKINITEYRRKKRELDVPEMPQLVQASKALYEQVKNIPDNNKDNFSLPPAASKRLTELQSLVSKGDEVSLTKVLFGDIQKEDNKKVENKNGEASNSDTPPDNQTSNSEISS